MNNQSKEFRKCQAVCECGEPANRLIKLLEETGFRIINSSIEKFSMFECLRNNV